MKKMFAVVMLLIYSNASFADTTTSNEPSTTPVYLVGFQTLDLLGNGKECLIEATYSADSEQVEVRSILTSPDEGNELALGPVQAGYTVNADPTKSGYYFSTSAAEAPVNEFLLIAATKAAPSDLAISFYHSEEGHYDFATCEKLVVASGAQLISVEDKFTHFEEIAAQEHEEEHEHEHDHGHNHSH